MDASASDPHRNLQPKTPNPLLRNRSYLILLGGQAISLIGTNASGITLPLLILALTHSPLQAGIAGALERVPFLLFGLATGALVDRWDRKRVMILSDAGRTVAFAAIPLAFWTGHLSMALIYAVVLAEGVGFAFFNVAEAAALPQVVAHEQLAAATAQNQASYGVSSLIGPPLGGLLFQLSRALPFLADAISYGISAISLLFIRTRFQEERERQPGSLGAEIKEGLGWLWRHPLLRTMAFLTGGINLAFAGAPLTVIVLAKQSMHASAAGIGLVFGLASIGGIAGAILGTQVQKRLSFGRAIIGVNWLVALIWPLFALAPNLVALGIVADFLFLVSPSYDIVQYSYRIALIPDSLQGRVNSVFRIISAAGLPLGQGVTGALLGWIGPRPTIMVTFVAMILLAITTTLSGQIRHAPPVEEARRALGLA